MDSEFFRRSDNQNLELAVKELYLVCTATFNQYDNLLVKQTMPTLYTPCFYSYITSHRG